MVELTRIPGVLESGKIEIDGEVNFESLKLKVPFRASLSKDGTPDVKLLKGELEEQLKEALLGGLADSLLGKLSGPDITLSIEDSHVRADATLALGEFPKVKPIVRAYPRRVTFEVGAVEIPGCWPVPPLTISNIEFGFRDEFKILESRFEATVADCEAAKNALLMKGVLSIESADPALRLEGTGEVFRIPVFRALSRLSESGENRMRRLKFPALSTV